MTLSVVDASASYKAVCKPNCSLGSSGKVRVVALLTVIPCCIAAGFAMLGAWLVLPFVGLEIFALGFAFYHVNSHADDYESISIEGDSLVIERRTGQQLSQFVLNPYWAKLVRHELPNGELCLGLLSHGKEIEIGRYLTKKQRELLAKQLHQRIGTPYK
ncbi:MAG: DUF2244 domain-containing protein [Methylophilaceae bacterium]